MENSKFKNKYVAILNGKIIDYDKNDKKLIERVYRKYGYKIVYIGFIGEEKVLEIPSPEVA